MQQLVIDATKQTFPELARQIVFVPAGMEHSTFEQPLPEMFSRQAATAHVNGKPIKGRYHRYPEMAAAGLWTTPTDLALFALDLQRAMQGESNRMLSTDMANKMMTRHRLAPPWASVGDGPFKVTGQGLGPQIHGADRALRISHSGIDEGFEAYWVAYPRRGQGAVVMANGNGALPLAQEFIRSVAREYAWPDFAQPLVRKRATVPVASYEALAGEYELRPGFRVLVTSEAGRLFVEAPGQPRFEILPESETRYYTQSNAALMHTFEKNHDGAVTTLLIELSGQSFRAIKVH
jgi:CubicO group peptidase (beta-lactamase class C family)